MYKIFLGMLIIVSGLVEAMSSEKPIDRVLASVFKQEQHVTAADIYKLEEALKFVSVSDINSIDEMLVILQSDESTPLTRAVYAGNITACRILIAHKADVNKADHKGTPLRHATNPTMIKFLREMGATGKSGLDI